MRSWKFVVLMTVALSGSPSFSQSTPTFDAASVRLSAADSVRGSDGGPGFANSTRYKFGRASLLDLIVTAYYLKSFQVSSRTALDQPAFDVVASLRANATKEDFRLMLQNLLAERFGLKVHIESRDFPAYEMVLGKNGGSFAGTTWFAS